MVRLSSTELLVTPRVNTSDAYYVDGIKVVGNRGASIADATDATDVITRLNDLLAELRTSTGHGIIAG